MPHQQLQEAAPYHRMIGCRLQNAALQPLRGNARLKFGNSARFQRGFLSILCLLGGRTDVCQAHACEGTLSVRSRARPGLWLHPVPATMVA
jgi:hypothetical protein